MENLCRPYISDRRANLSCKGNTDKTVHFPFITHKSILPRFGRFVKQETVGSFANGIMHPPYPISPLIDEMTFW